MNKKILLRKRLKRAALLVLLLMAGLGQSLAQEYHYDWDPSAYATMMSITGVVQIEGVEQFSTDLEIGAFCGDECRGRERANDVFFAMLNHYYVFMTIGGDNGDQLTFRLYDHALGEEVNVTCSNMTFVVDGTIGDPGSPYVFDFVDETTQTTQFVQGWNWWSSYIEMGNNGFAMLQEGLGTNGQMIKSMSNGYASYLSGFGWYGSHTSINNESTYQIRTNAACTVEMTGTAANPEDHPISLTPGWNWIGFPSPYAMSVDEAFSNFTPSNNDMIKAQECFAFYYTGYGWMGTLKTIEPGMGLLYKSNSANSITFAYPTLNEPSSGGENITAATNHWVPNMHLYESNMIVTGVVNLNSEELQSDQYEVGAFVDGECRGSARPMYVEALDQYVVFLTIAGGYDNNGNEVIFKLYDYENDAEFTMNESLSFEVNGVVGLPSDDAYEFGFSSIVDITCWADPYEGGTVTGAGSYAIGSTCTLTATAANAGYEFLYWADADGNFIDVENPYTFTVTEDAVFVAVFSANIYFITAIASPSSGGTVTGTGSYTYGQLCTLVATPDTGFHFVNWTKNGTVVSTELVYTFTVTENCDLVAQFEESIITQTTDFTQGWNWWSTYVEADDLFDQLKTGLGDNAQQIKSSTSFVNYFSGMWIGGLNSINNESCYLINANNACTFEMAGNQAMPSNHPITINPNWNWIGYPSAYEMSTVDALSNFTPSNGDVIKGQECFAVYNAGMWLGTLNTLEPGMGLMYKSNSGQSITMVYAEGEGGGDPNITAENNHWVPNYHAYEYNMNVVGIMTLDGMELQSDQYEVGAFVGDECRGSVKPIYVDALDQYVVFLTIAGGNDNNGDEVTFKLYDYENDAEFTMNETLSFEVNGIVGLPSDDAYEFEFSSIVDITCTVYPGEDAGTVTGTGSYTVGETCTLTATANEGYHFASWVLDDEVVSTAETYSFTVTEDADYVANFELNVYEITASANPEGATSYFYVDSPDNGYYWDSWEGSAISGVYGSYFAIEAIIDWEWYEMGYRFINWTKDGEVVSEDQWYEFTVTESAHYVANFERIVFDITLNTEPAEGGYAWVAGSVQLGEECYLWAVAYTGYAFENWTENGEVVSTDNPYVFTVTGDRELVAHFVLTPLSITATPNFDERGTVSGAGEYYLYDTVTLTATPNEGHRFVHWVNWMGDGYEVSAEPTYSFTVNGPRDLVAVFTAHEDDIIVFADLNVKDICVANWDTDGDFEITYDEAAAVTDLGNAFQSTEITTFDELQYFTGLTYIGGNAFSGCTGLTSITFPETLTTIGAEAFRGCSALRGAITLPESLESVGGYAFYGCDEITTVNYNAINCAEVGNAGQPAFYDCASLAHINIGENVQSIPNYAFKRCSTVEDISSAAVVPPTIGASTFATVSRSIPVSVPYGSGEAYRSAPYWEEFFNITEDYSPSQYTCHYNVDIHQFEQSMTAVGVIQIDGVEQATDALEIGAFVGDECRGRQLLAYYPQVDRYLVFLTLYGEDGDEFSFRLYDHEVGMESAKGCTTHLTFVANDVIGTLTNPHPFNFVDMQQTQLAAGWNWWSAYVELEGIDGLGMLEESLGTNGEMVKSQSDGYSSYLEGTGWYGSLTAINNESTYLVKVAEDCEVSLEAAFANPADHPVTLSNGWNWMGYPTATAMNLSTALDGFEASDDDLLKAQEGFAMYYTGLGWIGSLRTLMPGMGLMYKSNNGQSVTFTYPTATRQEGTDENITIQANYWATNAKAYPHNMNIVAVVELDGEELQGENYEIAAFANGEVRGSARLLYIEPLNRYLAFLTVAGDEATELHFGLYNAETGTVERQCLASLQYETNAIVGSLTEPYVVSFRGTTGVDEFGSRISMYPNPVASGQTVSINLPADNMGKVTVEVVNALGAVLSSETMSASSVTIKVPETAGVYMLRISSEDNGICFKKLVVR